MNKNAGISFLRILGCSSVFLAHCGIAFCWSGGAGVILFCMLSGLCLEVYGKPINGNKGIYYGISRISKLYPYHLLALIFAIPIHIYGENISFGWFVEKEKLFWLKALLVHAWIPSMNVYFSPAGIHWFVSAILFFYICYPFLSKTLNRVKSYWNVVIILICLYIQTIVRIIVSKLGLSLELSDWLSYIFPPIKISDFIIGINLGILTKRNFFKTYLLNEKRFRLVLSIGLLLYFVTNFIKNHWLDVAMIRCVGNYLCSVPCILMIIGATGSGIKNKCLNQIAERTMIYFIVHTVVISYLNVFINGDSIIFSNLLLYTGMIFLLTVSVSEILYRLRCNKTKRIEALNK